MIRVHRPARRGVAALAAAVLACLGLTVTSEVAHAATATGTDTNDSYVVSSNGTGNFGTAGNLRVAGGSPTKIGYYKFDVAGVPTGSTVSSAVLSLTGVGTQTAQTVSVNSVADTSWTEGTLNWNNHPAVGGVLSSGTMNTGVTLNADVSNEVTGNGTFSFAVTSAVASDSVIATKETAVSGAQPVLTVTYAVPVNQAPVVNAGTDQTVTLPSSASLSGTVTDDGLPNPPGATTDTWSKVSGPGTVTFGNPNADSTTASFSTSGSYTLRLTANDSALSSSDDLVVTVNPAAVNGPYEAYTQTSFFRTQLGSSWPVDSTSATGISWAKAHEPMAFPKLNGVPTTKGGSTVNGWGIGFALGQCSDPVWHFESGSNFPAQDSFVLAGGSGFHAPAGWVNHLPSNNDSPVEVIDRCGNSTLPAGFSIWAANVSYNGTNTLVKNPLSNSGGIVGGVFDDSSNGVDKGDTHSDSNFNQTSRGNIPDSFGIRTDEVVAGENGANNGTLGHVLQMFAMETDSSMGHVSPMTGNESGQAGYGAEGERIAVKPSWTPPSTCTGAALVVARTLQKYGAYLGNNSGSGSAIKVQQDDTTTGLYKNALGDCITWDDMAYVQRGWSQSW